MNMATTIATTLTLFLGFLALTSTFLSFNAEARPPPIGENLGSIVGTHSNLYDGLESIIEHGIKIDRHVFPEDFIFGTSVSAYQVEGAKKGPGRGLTTWDQFTHMHPDKVDRSSDGDLGVDFFTRYKQDVQLMKDLKTNGFRFSISWTRILPFGKLIGPHSVNEEGVKFYNDLINELLANGIEPAITLFHWESPLALEMEYGGFLSQRIVEDFRAFARFCFEKFGDRVKNWATFNEPSVYSVAGYSKGKKAPGRCSDWEIPRCPDGDSSSEPYTVAHHQILAHLAAVDEFRNCKKCQEIGGKIGIVLVSHWFEPQDPYSPKDVEAVKRSLVYLLEWFLGPLTYGHYPTIMRNDLKGRLPEFTEEESEKLRNSLDFVGLNYYGAFFATPLDNVNSSQPSWKNDLGVDWTIKQKYAPYVMTTSRGIVIYPAGLRKLLKHIKDEYMDPEIYVMENGMDEIDDGRKSLKNATDDSGRKHFIQSHILYMGLAIKIDNVKLKGYFIWSLMDNFEWEEGYRVRYGLYYVDFNDNMKRHMRSSGEWLSQFLHFKESLHKCYFDSFHEKGHPPEKLFPEEYLDPQSVRLQFKSDFM